MANKSIPLIDKKIVLSRLAEGLSTREAIRGTALASNSTAARLAKSQSHALAQYRKNYLWAIEHEFGAGVIERAALRVEMIHAVKNEIVGYSVSANNRNGNLTKIPIVGQVPDWSVRQRALDHIDKLADRASLHPEHYDLQVNFINESSDFTLNG